MPRILVIDDDEIIRHWLRVVLEAAGYEVIEAADGKAGLQIFREQGADLLFVDIFMPGQDGLEVIRSLRSEIPRPKIVAMSGGAKTAQGDMLKVAATLGALRTMRKPFAPRDLLAVVHDVLGSAEHP